MKKLALGCVLILGVNSLMFSLEETWFSVGFNFGNYFERGSDLGKFYSGSSGFNFICYSFEEKNNFGFFFNSGLNFSDFNNIDNGFDQKIRASFILGPGYRYNINEKLNLLLGFGLDINLYSLFSESVDIKTSDFRIGLGIGGDVGIKYDITKVIYVIFGTTLSYNFAN